MWKRTRLSLLVAGLCAATGLGSCGDDLGQPGEPDGPLLITRMTLLDNDSRDNPVFSDTSAPSDCMDATLKNTDPCQLDPFKDQFSLKNSPPTTDSAEDLRVVFNKLPLLLNGKDLLPITVPMAGGPAVAKQAPEVQQTLKLQCATAGCAVPKVVDTVRIDGAPKSPDPTTFPYGPSIQMSLDKDTDPLAALEPETSYSVAVDPGLSGRDGNKVQLDDRARKLLGPFTTESFKVLQVGIGSGDKQVYAMADQTYAVAKVPSNGAAVLTFNAPIDESLLKMTTATATAGGKPVPVGLSVTLVSKDPMTMKVTCNKGNQRALFVYPLDSMGNAGSWGMAGDIQITIQGADIHDLGQQQGHPAGSGRHSLKSNITLTVTTTGMAADMSYKGHKAGEVHTPLCSQMGSQADMAVAD